MPTKNGVSGGADIRKMYGKDRAKNRGFRTNPGQTPDRITGDELAKIGQKLIQKKGQGRGKSRAAGEW